MGKHNREAEKQSGKPRKTEENPRHTHTFAARGPQACVCVAVSILFVF